MLKLSNKFIRTPQPHYSQLINVWIDETTKKDVIKQLLLENKDFKIDRLRTNPVYHKIYHEIITENKSELQKLDQSWLWSRRFKKEFFVRTYSYIFFWVGLVIPYVFYKIIHKRILENHVKFGYTADNLKGLGHWDLDFQNRDMYPESVIKDYYETKKKRDLIESMETEAIEYSKVFVTNITNGYLRDYTLRRKQYGFDDAF